MIESRRRYPEPVPAIHPLREYEVTGKRKERYEDMKLTLQVPWMGVITMAYARYSTFFEVLWVGLKSLVRSSVYGNQAQALRRFVEDEVRTLEPPPLARRLREVCYAERELDNIRNMIEIFSRGNYPYLIIATVARLLLEGGEMHGTCAVQPYEGRHAPQVQVPFVLMEAHHAEARTRAVYEDIKSVAFSSGCCRAWLRTLLFSGGSLNDPDQRKAEIMMRFFADESCSQCTPCHVGTEKPAGLMALGKWGKDLLEELSQAMADASICGLGQDALNPIRCVMKYFSSEVLAGRYV